MRKNSAHPEMSESVKDVFRVCEKNQASPVQNLQIKRKKTILTIVLG